jgi:3-oxoacyl-[acyl-carrier-protein] synthase-3
MGARITGSGSYLPGNRVTNAALEKLVDTSDEWIVQRTGIRARHLLKDGDIPSDMSVIAGKRALDAAAASPNDVNLLIVATNFPDMICPGSAAFVSQGLNLGETPFFDLKAGCSGFVYGLAVADGLIRVGMYSKILLIGAEALSRVTDWQDRRTCVLFGDGAGAVLLEPAGPADGVLGCALYGDPEKTLLLHMPGGGTRTPPTPETIEARAHYVKMEGAGVFRNAAPMMEQATYAALAVAELTLSDVDWIIPHQANIRIIRSLARRLGVSWDRIVVNLDRVANTSAASIPIALDEAVRSGRIESGQLVVMTAFGAGVTYGAVVIRM